jgi:hypothetical protein
MKPTPFFCSLLRGLKQVLLMAGGLSFLVGGGLIAALTKMNRFSAEIVGIGLCALFVLLGLLAGALSDKFDDDENLSIGAPD